MNSTRRIRFLISQVVREPLTRVHDARNLLTDQGYSTAVQHVGKP